jgi:hypothetical protein
MWTVKDGIAYRALDQLVYGYSWLAFPHRHSLLRDWWFVDANTGRMIIGVLPPPTRRRLLTRPRWRLASRFPRLASSGESTCGCAERS